MDILTRLTIQEKTQLKQTYKELLKLSGSILQPDDCQRLKKHLIQATLNNFLHRDVFGMNPILNDMETAIIVASEIGLTRGSILGVMLHTCVRSGYCTVENIESEFSWTENENLFISHVSRLSHGNNRSPERECTGCIHFGG